MELAAKKTSGVRDAAVYFMAPKISAEFEKDADPDAVMQNALKACKKGRERLRNLPAEQRNTVF